MNSDQLKQFNVVARTENLREASEILFISASALSKTIATLEKELSCTLFNRIGKTIILNENGRKLLAHSEVIAEELEQIDKEFAALRKSEERFILISKTQFYFATLLNAEANIDFSHYGTIIQSPDSTHTMLDSLLNHEVHAVIDYDLPEYANKNKYLRKYILAKEQYNLFVYEGDPWYKRQSIDIKELSNRTFIACGDNILWQREFQDYYNTPFDTNYYDRSTFLTALIRNKDPLLSATFPFTGFISSTFNQPIKSRRNIKLIGYKPREVYVYWLPENDELIKKLLENMKKFYAKKLTRENIRPFD